MSSETQIISATIDYDNYPLGYDGGSFIDNILWNVEIIPQPTPELPYNAIVKGKLDCVKEFLIEHYGSEDEVAELHHEVFQ